jgi:DNA-binding PadR family transcriptional regulator
MARTRRTRAAQQRLDARVHALLPLSPPVFHLLAALAEADMHGWALMKAVERATEGRVRLSPGTLYGMIKRLLQQELIAESDRRPPTHWDDERRRYYRLTELGRATALAEMEHLQTALEAGRRLLPEPATVSDGGTT